MDNAGRKRIYKHIKPVGRNGKQLLEVCRKDPQTKKTVYLRRHRTVQQCCKALRERFPEDSILFSATKLKWKKAKAKNPEDVKKIKYTGITPTVLPNGKKIWRAKKKFRLNSRYYDSQIAAARAVARSEGIAIKDLKPKKFRLPMMPRDNMRAIYPPAMALSHRRKPDDSEKLENLGPIIDETHPAQAPRQCKACLKFKERKEFSLQRQRCRTLAIR